MGIQSSLQTFVRSCQLGEVIGKVLSKTGNRESQRTATYNVSQKFRQSIPELFSGTKNLSFNTVTQKTHQIVLHSS